MTVRRVARPEIMGQSSQLGLPGEALVHFLDGHMESIPTGELEILLGERWINMRQAFADKHLLPDRMGRFFLERKYAHAKEIKQGWVDLNHGKGTKATS